MNQTRIDEREVREVEKFRSINIDVEKGIYQVNGEDIGNNASRLKLEFEDGEWSLEVSRDSHFATTTAICRCQAEKKNRYNDKSDTNKNRRRIRRM